MRLFFFEWISKKFRKPSLRIVFEPENPKYAPAGDHKCNFVCLTDGLHGLMKCAVCGDVRKSICTYWSDRDEDAYIWIKPGESLTLQYETQKITYTFNNEEASFWRDLNIEQIHAGYEHGWFRPQQTNPHMVGLTVQ